MKVLNVNNIVGSDREVHFPTKGFISLRAILKKDGMGFSLHKTIIPKGTRLNWHYKHQLEACYCVSGLGLITNNKTNETYEVKKDTVYMLDKHDDHTFSTLNKTTLISVFNPPIEGVEVHQEDGSYPATSSPVYGVKAIHMSKIIANDYNPNKVAPPEMDLLETSIWEDGYTQPIVTCYDPDKDEYTVVDGFHRHLIMQTSKRIREREKEMLPIVVISKQMGDRMASTIRHNRARGSHNIELMSTIVSELVEMGKGDRWICKHVGMSIDELLRMKQITGLASLFTNTDFSDSWNAVED